jgi:hypothetical protein
MTSELEPGSKFLPSKPAHKLLCLFLVVAVAGGLGAYGWFWYDAYGPYGYKRIDGHWSATDGSGRTLAIGKGGWEVRSSEGLRSATLSYGGYREGESSWVFERTDGAEIDVEMGAWFDEIKFDGVAYKRTR